MIIKKGIFHTTFLLSLVFHATVLLPIPNFMSSESKTNDELDLTYTIIQEINKQKIELPPIEKPRIVKDDPMPAQEIRQKPPHRFTGMKKDASIKKNPIIKKKPEIKKSTVNTVKKIARSEAIVPKKTKKIIAKKAILDESLAKSKVYFSYYKIINEQLRQSVILPDNFSEGEVALSFMLTSDGVLRNVEVLKSTAITNLSLTDAAVEIVQNAAPFPPFPKNLKNSKLTFNIVICFRERG